MTIDEDKKVIAIDAAPNLAVARREAPVPMALAEHYSGEQLNIIRGTIAKGCSDTELVFFLTFCRNAGLDPFQKEIFAIPRGQGAQRQVTLQMSIDGLRRRAHDTKTYAGMDRPTFGPEMRRSANNMNIIVPEWCEIVVYKLVGNQRVPFPAHCYFKEYAPPLNEKKAHMWRKMPYNQLEKVTEAKALRRAFPEQVRGIYEPAEFDSQDPPIDIELPPEQGGVQEVVQTEAVVKNADESGDSSSTVQESQQDLTDEQQAVHGEWVMAVDQADTLQQLIDYAGVIAADERMTRPQRLDLKERIKMKYASLKKAAAHD